MKKQKGITLIALVITIIIILILVGITLSMALGEKGILGNAKTSKNKTNFAQLKEDVGLAYLAYKSQSGDKKGLDTFLNELDNVTVEELCEGTWSVKREEDKVTISDDGDITIGEVDVWDKHSIECPEIKLENNKYNWYIYNSAQLKFLADFVNNANALTDDLKAIVLESKYEENEIVLTNETTVYLMNNLDLGARPKNGVWETEENEATKWTPIGLSGANAFIAKFEGNNNFISGIYENENQYVGLFGVSSNSIKNLSIKNSYIKGVNGLGAIAGVKSAGDIENCHNVNTTIMASGKIIGGLVGQMNGNIKNSTNTGKVLAAERQIGGIVGRFKANNEIQNCINYGEVKSTYEGIAYVGGIVGYLDGLTSISDCTNSGEVSGYNTIGGVCGVSNGRRLL